MPSPATSTSRPTGVPYIEPNPNANIPAHFTASKVRSCDDLTDPDFHIFEETYEGLNQIPNAG